MGKIFGIADLPVSTIMTPFEPIVEFQKPFEDDFDYATKTYERKFEQKADTFVSRKPRTQSNPFVKMRNGFGKLMKHFSKKI
jgi:hypothetical protein